MIAAAWSAGRGLHRLAAVGEWLRRHARAIRVLQWGMVAFYLVLLVVPALLPLPPSQARMLDHVTVAAQFLFWGVWWPFVLVSVVLFGRLWCGLLCPEGTLTEWASRHGRQRGIPRWVRWPGWPFVAFAGTTVYGQMISVYQYPKATLLMLGGSTVAAMAIGYLYGRDKRVWCRYLCPVSGVFRLLAKLSPLHFQVDPDAWHAFRQDRDRPRMAAPNCPTLLPLRTMTGAADCHMCGRCSFYSNAIALSARPPNEEIVRHGRADSAWSALLLLYCAIGLAMGAFSWSASPWFVTLKQIAARWLIAHGHTWSLDASAPWWLFTNYPAQNDVFSLLDGALLVFYLTATALLLGSVLTACIALARLALGAAGQHVFHHLAQALVPIAGAGLFLGLSMVTVGSLRFEGFHLSWIPQARMAFLSGVALWSAWLAWRIAGRYATGAARVAALGCMLAAIGSVSAGWILLFWVW